MKHVFLVRIGLSLAALLLAGCSSPEMKGSPFYSGEYKINVPDADERRVNLWPLAYYRDPALSVLWPVFEHTEEHVAVRPLFSAYGDAATYWEYNLLWPLCQADTRGEDYRIFPFFWGKTPHDSQRYHVFFPFVWHYADEASALLPLWLYRRDRGVATPTDRDLWLLPPLLRYHTSPDRVEWHAGFIYDYCNLKRGERRSGYPWPLLFSWREPDRHGRFTPLYAYETSDGQGVRDGWDALPLLLSWRRRHGEDSALTAALGVYHRNESGDRRSGWLLPFVAYDTRDRLLLTPLVGRNDPDPDDPDGYWYALTPLAGFRTGAHTGGWAFPLFDHTVCPSNSTYKTRFLALGHAERQERRWDNHLSESAEFGFFPLFSHSHNSSIRRDPKTSTAVRSVSRANNLALLCWSRETTTTSCSTVPGAAAREDFRMTSTDSGFFPFWSAETREKTRLDGTRLSSTDESSLLLAFYDTKSNMVAADGTTPALDYKRRRILWHVWHYERRNGNTSIDLFPFITRDTHADGFRKTAFLWRFYRYERSADGRVSRDLLFLPVLRD